MHHQLNEPTVLRGGCPGGSVEGEFACQPARRRCAASRIASIDMRKALDLAADTTPPSGLDSRETTLAGSRSTLAVRLRRAVTTCASIATALTAASSVTVPAASPPRPTRTAPLVRERRYPGLMQYRANAHCRCSLLTSGIASQMSAAIPILSGRR